MRTLNRRFLPFLLVAAVVCLLLVLRLGFSGPASGFGTSAADASSTNPSTVRTSGVGKRTYKSVSPGRTTGSTRFASGRLNALDKLDCRRAYDSGVQGQAPELATLSWMLRSYNLNETDHYLAVIRLYELVHRHASEKSERKEEIERTLQRWSRADAEGVDGAGAAPEGAVSRLEALREVGARWDRLMAKSREEATTDLQEMLGVMDGEWIQAVFAISPTAPPTLFDYVPIGTPRPTSGQSGE